METETLADKMIREWSSRIYRSKIDRFGWIPRTIAHARKFVLDTEMSAFVADLSYASLPVTSHPRRIKEVIESQRAGARLPFPATWIELDMLAKTKRAEEYGAHTTGYVGPARIGWLMVRHPHNENAFMAVHCGSQSLDPNTQALIDHPNAAPVAYVWVTDDSPLPWKTLSPAPYSKDRVAQWLIGIEAYDGYGERLGFSQSPYVTKEFAKIALEADEIGIALQEQAGDVRSIWALLSTMNDVPTITGTVRPSKGHMVGGNYRKFVEHTVISLRVPQKISLRTFARRIARAARRRAHSVRGHWRIDWRVLPSALCDHLWTQQEDGSTCCSLCKGRRLWVKDHQRGDASLGFVLHDYSVQRGHL